MSAGIYLKHRDGATHYLTGRRFAKLVRAMRDGRGGAEVMGLIEAGYVEFFGPGVDLKCVDDMSPADVGGAL